MRRHESLTRPEFEGWVTEMKTSLNGIEERLDRHEVILHEHTRILNDHSSILHEHTRILNDHSSILHEHTRILNDHTRILEQMATSLNAIRDNTDAMLKLYRRVDHRTEALATKVGLDLRQVDSAA